MIIRYPRSHSSPPPSLPPRPSSRRASLRNIFQNVVSSTSSRRGSRVGENKDNLAYGYSPYASESESFHKRESRDKYSKTMYEAQSHTCSSSLPPSQYGSPSPPLSRRRPPYLNLPESNHRYFQNRTQLGSQEIESDFGLDSKGYRRSRSMIPLRPAPPIPDRPSILRSQSHLSSSLTTGRLHSKMEGFKPVSEIFMRRPPQPTSHEIAIEQAERYVNSLTWQEICANDIDGGIRGKFGINTTFSDDLMSVRTYIDLRKEILKNALLTFSDVGNPHSSQSAVHIDQEILEKRDKRPSISISIEWRYSTQIQDPEHPNLADIRLQITAIPKLPATDLPISDTDLENLRLMKDELVSTLNKSWKHPVFWEDESKKSLILDLGLSHRDASRNLAIRGREFIESIRSFSNQYENSQIRHNGHLEGQDNSLNPPLVTLFHDYPGVDVYFVDVEHYDGYDDIVGRKAWDQWKESLSLNRSLRTIRRTMIQ